jgi:YVTN family beta-propeller protein
VDCASQPLYGWVGIEERAFAVAVGSGPTIGAELGGYRLEALVGRGGMSAVYRAEDLRLGRRVALKLLAPELAQDARFRERFLAESRLAASIDHANIVPIFEAGEADGLLYIAMRFVEGTDLRALLRDGSLAPERAIALIAQLAEALDAAHARGLVHRDVKPSNALVTLEGAREHVYLADFGLTKHTTSRGGPTATGQMVGTVDYVAPEQIRGDEVDGRADLYSLGCVLFECLTGEVPFPRRSDVATIYAHLEDNPPRASHRDAGVPTALDAVLVRALAKDPKRRWQTGGELAAAARTALPAGQPARGARRVPHLSRPAALAALGVVLALAAAVGALLIGGSGGGNTLAAIGANAVAVIDPANASLSAQVPVGASPAQIATGEGAAWVTNAEAQTVSRIDPATHTIRQTIDVGSGAGAIAVGEHGVWVVNSLDGTISWISPDTNREVKRIPVGNGPTGICVGGGSVWVANADDRTIWRLDPDTGRRTQTIRVDHRPTALACGGGAVWVGSESSGTVAEIATATGREVQHIDAGGTASVLAFAGGTLWIVNALSGTVSAIDPLRGAVASTVALGTGAGPTAIAADDRGAWVSNEFAATVVRIDRRRGAIVRTLRVGNRPQGIAVVGGALWVGVRASGARHRGGTLRILSELTFNVPADPVDAGGAVLSAQIANIAYDGLTAFRRVGNRAGQALVPDLAVSLPTPTDGGRTYTFRLRPEIHYSSGELVRASDIRRGLERTLRAGTAGQGPFFADIVGARTCLTRPRACDLSRGIVVDDAARTVTFHLTRPDPDLLTKLALPGAVAVAPRPALYPARRPLPATGPYLIAGFEPSRFVRLVRNPRFRAWSTAAKPDGFPDEITVRLGSDQAAAVRAVERGDADYVFGEVQHESPQLLDTLFARYAGQVHTNSQLATRYLFLNSRVPPFDDANVRRAVNYAIDRRAAVALVGGPHTSQPTCQILPPNFPGYVPYCPYTAHPGQGRRWSAPDLRKARRLIAGSHTRGMRVDVWAPDPEMSAQARLAVRMLDDLGYRARLRLLPATRYWRYISNSRHRAQIGTIWWGSDFPAASDYLEQLFGCRSFHTNDSHNINWSEFCDRNAERLMDRALRLQPTDARAANALWARAERRMVDQAAAVPLDNPKQVDVLSRRVGNYEFSPQWGVLLDQLWVR